MSNSRWLEISRTAYGALLHLYPKEHRRAYGEAMRQVFADLCRSSFQQRGGVGIIALWLRILPDLSRTAIHEHITAPGAGAGLMEPVPNAPLPWKGVLLVLLPGLVYLAGQVAQLSGKPWYMTLYYQAAFVLIIPVVLAWVITRRFPIWGLIPFGLLYRVVEEAGYELRSLQPDTYSSSPLINAALQVTRLIPGKLWISAAVFVLGIVLLLWRHLRQQKPARSFWMLLGATLLVLAAQIGFEISWIAQYAQADPHNFAPIHAQDTLYYFVSLDLYDFGAVLLLIFAGSLFTARHGFYAILVPIGYILPAILVGIGTLDAAPNPAASLAVASTAILIYRALLSFIAPVWMARSRTQTGKVRAVLISLAIALGIHAAVQFYPAPGFGGQPADTIRSVSVALDELKIISAIALGIVLYGGRPETGDPLPGNEIGPAASEPGFQG